MSNKFERLNPDEVISTSVTLLNLSRTFKVRELLEEIKSFFSDKDMKKLFDTGL